MTIHLLTGLVIAATTAPSFQDLAALDARVAAVAAPGAAVPIDKRIKLAPCPNEPEVSLPAAGAVAVRCAALGWKLRVALTGAAAAQGEPAAPLIRRGDTIEIVARGGGYSVSSAGTALEDGAPGASIRVKIPTSPSPVTAVVARAGVASIAN